MLPYYRRPVLIHPAAFGKKCGIVSSCISGRKGKSASTNSLFQHHVLVPNVNSYMSQLSISQSRRSAEAVFGLSWSALPASGDPVLQKSSGQGDQPGEQCTLVTRD